MRKQPSPVRGLTVGAITTTASGSVPPGAVISQNPGAGISVAAGSSIALVVSLLPDLSLSNVRVTQAVFGTSTLVLNREAVILADVELLAGSLSDTVLVGAQFGNKGITPVPVTFAAGDSHKSVELFFTPTIESPKQDLIVTVNPGGQIVESNDKNNSSPAQSFKVVKTKDLDIAYVGISGCQNGVPCFTGSLNNFSQHISQATKFMGNNFPVSRWRTISEARPFIRREFDNPPLAQFRLVHR